MADTKPNELPAAEDWMIFRGDRKPRKAVKWPAAPPWRAFDGGDRIGTTYQPSADERLLVNAAIYLRRPVLITGKPGSGKSSLAYAVALELGLDEVLRWPINSRSTLADGLYRYDALARLREAPGAAAVDARAAWGKAGQSPVSAEDIGRYITLGPLGTALYPAAKPRVLLIDEVDKSDIDLPNDLLHAFENGTFDIAELARHKAAGGKPGAGVWVRKYDSAGADDTVEVVEGRVQCSHFPLVFLTSNGERDMPPAFYRRCLRLDIKDPDADRLARIVDAHFAGLKTRGVEVKRLIEKFDTAQIEKKVVAIDQLMNAVFLLARDQAAAGAAGRAELEELLLRELGTGNG